MRMHIYTSGRDGVLEKVNKLVADNIGFQKPDYI